MADETIHQEYILDTSVENNSNAFSIQGEINARTLDITFQENSIPLNLANCSTIIRFERPDKTSIFNQGVITDEINGKASYLITSQMTAVADTFDITFDIVGTNSTTKVVGLSLTVLESLSDNAVQSTNEMTALQAALSQTQSQISQLQEFLIQVGSAVSSANTAVDNINLTITQANSVIVQANTEIINMQKYYYMFDPSTGMNSLMSTVVTNMFRILIKGNCLTAGAYDALNITAGAFDAKHLSAYDYDTNSKNLLP